MGNLIWNCGREETRWDPHFSIVSASEAIRVPEPSAPKPPGRTNYLYIRALDPVLCQPQRLYTFPTLCHLSQPFKKAWNLSPRPFQGTARKRGCWVRITWAAWSKEDGVLVLQQFASPHLPFQMRQLRLTVSALCERGVSPGKREPGGLTGREGVREPGCILTQAPEGHHCNLKPTNEIKLIKKKKKKTGPKSLADF